MGAGEWVSAFIKIHIFSRLSKALNRIIVLHSWCISDRILLEKNKTAAMYEIFGRSVGLECRIVVMWYIRLYARNENSLEKLAKIANILIAQQL